MGEGVTDVAPGDFVVLNWRAVCGSCRACLRGEPWYCFATHNATQRMTLEDGTELTPALGIGSFAEKTLVAAGQCTKVDPSARAAAVGLLGCGVMAGLGAAINTGNVDPRQVRRGHRLRRRRAWPPSPAPRSPAPRRSSPSTSTTPSSAGPATWAPPTRSTRKESEPVEAIQALTGGHGADVVIDAVGRPETWKQAFYARDLAGTVVLVGVPTPDMTIPDIPLIDVFGRGGSLKSSWYGDCLPSRDFPMLVDLYQQGRLDLDAFVTEEISIDDVEAAFDKMHGGAVLRSVVVVLMGGLRVDHAVVSGTFSLDGEVHEVDNNIWVVGDDEECVVIDAPHDVDAILDVVAGRQVKAILLTHAHDDHCRVAPELRRAGERADPAAPRRPAAVGADPHRRAVGRRHRGRPVDQGGRRLAQGPAHARARARARSASTCTTSTASSPATPCSRAARARPGARSATRDLIKDSIRAQLFRLPDETVVHTGHGDDTTIAAEREALA